RRGLRNKRMKKQKLLFAQKTHYEAIGSKRQIGDCQSAAAARRGAIAAHLKRHGNDSGGNAFCAHAHKDGAAKNPRVRQQGSRNMHGLPNIGGSESMVVARTASKHCGRPSRGCTRPSSNSNFAYTDVVYICQPGDPLREATDRYK